MLQYYNMVNLFIVYLCAMVDNDPMYSGWQCVHCIAYTETRCKDNPKTLCASHNLNIL